MSNISGKFESSLEKLINSEGVDNQLGVPDYILSEFLTGQLHLLDRTLKEVKRHESSAQIGKEKTDD